MRFASTTSRPARSSLPGTAHPPTAGLQREAVDLGDRPGALGTDASLYDAISTKHGSLAPDGVFRGSLYLKGYGDPSLATAAYQRGVLHLRGARLADFVSALRRAGIKRVVGRIVGDASYFDAR